MLIPPSDNFKKLTKTEDRRSKNSSLMSTSSAYSKASNRHTGRSSHRKDSSEKRSKKQNSSIKESFTPKSKSKLDEEAAIIDRSIQNSYTESSNFSSTKTDSLYTNSFHDKQNAPSLHGPPPLKRTFINESSDSESFEGDINQNGDDGENAYRRPEWNFPYKRISRNDDSLLFEALKDRFSVKNIVSQLKRMGQ